MKSLPRAQRDQLAKTTEKARTLAEEAVGAAIRNLAVHEKDYRPHMSVEQRQLRNRLRARSRALGDTLDPRSGVQEIAQLVEDAAYEHWHRLLFTRFLAENDLLVTDEANGQVAVSLEECDELAPELGAKDGFELACRFAAEALPGVFRSDDPILELTLASNHAVALRKLLEDLPRAIFTADDALGWTYQFWQTQRKKQVNDSGKKIGADEISPVTQLFTEDYMVDFLLDNTLGAWWAGRCAAVSSSKFEVSRCPTEEDARRACALPGCEWKYLRFIRSDESASDLKTENSTLKTPPSWKPAAGTFEGWPKTVAELTCLDPCMGSGHFVVAMFERLVALRMAEEGCEEKAAVTAVIRDNLFGLELDPRCTQIAAFNLALAAWRRVGFCVLPAMNLACSGLAPNAKREDWLTLAGDNEKLQNGMERLFNLFEKAPVLGSLINPRHGADNMFVADYHEVSNLLQQALQSESPSSFNLQPSSLESAVTARGLAKAAEILAGQFTLVATNVPYLKNGKQEEALQEYCEVNYPNSKGNLACVFVERCLSFCADGATFGGVVINEMLFLVGYRKLRERLLADFDWNFVAKLGAGAFETITGEVVNVSLVAKSASRPSIGSSLIAIDAGELPQPELKADTLRTACTNLLSQKRQLLNPDARITVADSDNEKLLSAFCDFGKGSVTGDGNHYLRTFWELPVIPAGYRTWANSPSAPDPWSGRERIVMWELKGHDLRGEIGHMIRGDRMWGHAGVGVCKMSGMEACIYSGELFDDNIGVLLPNKKSDLPAIFAFAESPDYRIAIRKIDQAIKVTAATLVKVPFDLAHWQKVAAEKYPNGLPKPFSSDPTQWLFNGHPAESDAPLHVAVARLLGYEWPRQTGSSFPDCPALGPDGLESFADGDGVVCLSAIHREATAGSRLRKLLAAALGNYDERALIQQTGSTKTSLEDWLRDDFFKQHVTLFHNRPFVWHVWDGLGDGFHVLLNYHRLDHATLNTLTYTYLGDWIREQKAAAGQDVPGAAERLKSALALQVRLAAILAGEAPLDLFVRWKPLSKQAIGWHPDLNDGVRLNIRPFLLGGDVGLKGAGLFRSKPGIVIDPAKADRGTEPVRDKAEYPWFWSKEPPTTDPVPGKEYAGRRWNGVHLTLARKREAQGK